MPTDPVLRALDSHEIRAQATADGHLVIVTDELLRVGSHDRVKLDVPIRDVRRIQFDIERDRPATLVIVPMTPQHEPQVIVVQPDDYAGVAQALAVIGERMAALSQAT